MVLAFVGVVYFPASYSAVLLGAMMVCAYEINFKSSSIHKVNWLEMYQMSTQLNFSCMLMGSPLVDVKSQSIFGWYLVAKVGMC